MITRTLTGNTRHRTQSFTGKLVLQVEVECKGYTHENAGGRVESVDVDYVHWRDATILDLQAIHKSPTTTSNAS